MSSKRFKRDSNSDSETICNVWAYNLCSQFKIISELVAKRYKFVALDTEFPGIICKAIGHFDNQKQYHYQNIRYNVNQTKVIQIGLTLMDSTGCLPSVGATTWQFNFRFDLNEDTFAEDSIQLLSDSGLEFDRLAIDGIDGSLFAELLMASGLVLTDDCKWISFHGGYDFGHILRLLTAQELPSEAVEFDDLLKLYFPIVFDIKFLMHSLDGFVGSLEDIANQLNVSRVGRRHQAGSDSLVSGKVFFRLLETHFSETLDQNKYCGHLYGLENRYVWV